MKRLPLSLALIFSVAATWSVNAETPAVDAYGDPLPKHVRARLGTARFRHGGQVQWVHYLPDGKSLITFGTDETLRVWEADSGRQRHALKIEPSTGDISLDGRIRASLVNRQHIQLWDVVTGKLLRKLDAPAEGSSSWPVVFSPDGKLLAAAGTLHKDVVQGTIRLFDVASGKELWRLGGPKEEGEQIFLPHTILFSPNGKIIASVGQEKNTQGIVRLWDVASGKELPPLDRSGSGMATLAFTPDSKCLVDLCPSPLNQQSTWVRLWDVATSKEIRALAEVKEQLTSPVISPDSKTLAVVATASKVVQLWDMATGKQRLEIEAPPDNPTVTQVAFAPAGKVLAVGYEDGTLHLYDAVHGKEKHVLKGCLRTNLRPDDAPAVPQASFDFSPDGLTLASFAGPLVRRWDVATGKELRPVADASEDSVLALAPSADGKRLFAADSADVVSIWDVPKRQRIQRLTGPTEPVGPGRHELVRAVLTPDGKALAVNWTRGSCQLFDAQTGKALRAFSDDDFLALDVAFGNAGRTLITATLDGRLLWWDAASGKLLRRITDLATPADEAGNVPLARFVSQLAVAPDGKIVAAAGFTPDGYQLRFWELATGKLRRRVPIEIGQGRADEGALDQEQGNFIRAGIKSLAFAPDGKFLAWALYDNIHLYDVRRGKVVRQFGGQKGGLNGLAFAPDGKLLAAAANDGTVRLWETATGTALGQLAGHRGSVHCLAFSADGQTLFTGGSDTTVLLWDVAAALREARDAPKPTAAEMTALWQQLADDDGEAADAALSQLTLAPEIVAWLKDRVKPAPAVDKERIARLVADLEDNRFEVRSRATDALEKLGTLAELQLRKRLDDNPPLEVKQRIEPLLEKMAGAVTDVELARALRVVEILEQTGSAEAQALLQTLAKGAPEARLTQEAQTALARLAPRE